MANKSVTCKQFLSPGGCQYGARCAYAHGDAEVSLHKTVMCKQFNTPTGCRFADKCAFAHGEAELRPKPAMSDLQLQQHSSAQQYLMNMQQHQFTPFTSAPVFDNLDESLDSLQMREAQVQVQIQQLEAQHMAAQQALAQQAAMEQASYEQQRQGLFAMSAQLQQRISERGGVTDGNGSTAPGIGLPATWDPQLSMLYNGIGPMHPSMPLLPSMSMPFVGMGMMGAQPRPTTSPGANPIQMHRYKTSLCKQFSTPTGCRFADKCAFAHGDAELQPKPPQTAGST
jgi:hypothetical protein